ncbi:MAG: UDP-N-acetylmuramate dehydrogenase [Oscillospiraceae bacterium]|nr:UDP-N-acetylmuramate dehydrogenase [Oscillospiraceae bacterium]
MTIMTAFQQKITELLPHIELNLEESLAKHTSFRIGGPAEVMAFPKTKAELSEILKTSALLDCKPVILGAGTNILAPDAGVRGLVICLRNLQETMEKIDDSHIRVSAGVSMARCATFAANLGLSGLEFAHGIPGSVGGGVYMNAGAYGGEICQVCTEVEVMDADGNSRVLTGEEMDFSYRHSRLECTGDIVLSATFALTKKPTEEIRSVMQDLMTRRRNSQPLDLPSAGSAFKRPVGGYAAALIDQTGLKGYRVGSAAVSEKHAGFVVNLGGATAEDVKKLLQDVSQKVFASTGISLEPEIRIW